MAEDDKKNKIFQNEILMEKIRNSNHKGFPELAKAVRMSMLEKRYALDSVEKSIIRKCLDSLTHSIKQWNTTRSGLCERLESLSRQLGLKLTEDSNGLFISCDMFYLEIILDPNGSLKDVKVHHECKIEQSESELVTCLLNGDFADFTVQLEALSSIYQLNAEPKVKSKAFVALHAMETDLFNLFKRQSYNKDIATLLGESPVGIVQKRRGGHPMKLVYFVPVYDLLNLETKSMQPLTLETLNKSKDVGLYVTVNLEASSANKLQILPTVNFSKDNNFPMYTPLSSINSILLPATFVLRLNKPLPVCASLLPQMGILSTESFENGEIMNLCIREASKSSVQNSTKGLYVTLPDQCHCYFFAKNKNLTGSIITNVQFTEPSQVPKILSALKQQAMFYTLIASCVRGECKMNGLETATILEVNAISIYTISVALQHPYEESLVSVEFDLSELQNVDVKIYSLSNNSYDSYNKILTKIAKASLSIPITIRHLLKLWNQDQIKKYLRVLERNGNGDYRSGKDRNSGSNNDANNGEGTSRQQFFPTNVTNSTANESTSMSNQFQLKGNELREFPTTAAGKDFCKNPKSELGKLNSLTTFNFGSNSDNSLGDPIKTNVTGNLTIENQADLWNRNNVSITPISSVTATKSSTELNVNGIKIEQQQQQQRSQIEIIPLLNKVQTSISIMPVPGTSSGSNKSFQQTSKKKNEDRDPSKIDKKRRKKEHQSSTNVQQKHDKVELKVIEVSSKIPSPSSSKTSSSKSLLNTTTLKKINAKGSPSSKSSSSSPKQSPLHSKHSNSISTGGKPNLTTLKNTTSGNLLLNEQKFKPISTKEKSNSYLESNFKKSSFNKDYSKNIESIEDHYIFDDSDFNDSHFDMFDSSSNSSRSKSSLLSAVIDKLKYQAQNNEFDLNVLESKNYIDEKQSSKFNSEYMVKPSSDGMKLTLKTTISSPSHGSSSKSVSSSPKRPPSSSSSNSGNLSPNKKHTGLKPGVSAGPASKKSSANIVSKTDFKPSSSFYKSASSESLPKPSSSSGTSLSKSFSSHCLNASASRKDPKTYSNKIKINTSAEKPSNRTDSGGDLMKMFQYSSGKNALEGLVKSLDTNFQIPKLSAKTTATSSTDEINKNKLTNLPIISASIKTDGTSKESDISSKNLQNSFAVNLSKNISFEKSFTKTENPSVNSIGKNGERPMDSLDLSLMNKNISSIQATSSSSSKLNFNTNSPAVSVRIIKSPAPSPMTVDDELMDDSSSLVGIGK